MPLKTICVYCGSNPGSTAEYMQAARGFGAMLAGQGIALVYGGGRTGLMGAVADGALAAGGKVTGIIPRSLIAKEVAHQGLTELRAVDSMHQRKLAMSELADGFVALPGGIGTLEEIAEIFTWSQLGFHRKPCALLDVAGFYEALRAFLENMVQQGFLLAEHLATLLIETDPAVLLERMKAWHPVTINKWTELTTVAASPTSASATAPSASPVAEPAKIGFPAVE